jgi:TPR repeat protein
MFQEVHIMRRMVVSVLLGLCIAGLASAQRQSEAACEAGDRKACFEMGTAYAQGTGVEASMNEAIPFFLRACDRGMPEGCTTAGGGV